MNILKMLTFSCIAMFLTLLIFAVFSGILTTVKTILTPDRYLPLVTLFGYFTIVGGLLQWEINSEKGIVMAKTDRYFLLVVAVTVLYLTFKVITSFGG